MHEPLQTTAVGGLNAVLQSIHQTSDDIFSNLPLAVNSLTD